MSLSDHEWDQGRDLLEYIRGLDFNAPTWQRNLDSVDLGPFAARLGRLGRLLAGRTVRAAVFSEAWCGDCVENVPVVARLARDLPWLEARAFPRGSELMQRYLTGGRAVIPTVVFFLPGGPELYRFIERPAAAHRFLRARVEGADGAGGGDRAEALRRARRDLRQLYAEGLRAETVDEILSGLEQALTHTGG